MKTFLYKMKRNTFKTEFIWCITNVYFKIRWIGNWKSQFLSFIGQIAKKTLKTSMPILNPSSVCNLSCSQNAFLCNLSCSVQSGTCAPLSTCICDAEGQRCSTACQHALGISRKLGNPSSTFVFQEIPKFLAHGHHLLFVWEVFGRWQRFDGWVIFLVCKNK